MSNKKDFRIYCEEEYLNYLKQVAEEQNTSVNRMVMELVEKKYPMPRKTTHKTDVRIYISDDKKEQLKLIAEEQGVSVNQLVMSLIEKKYFSKKSKPTPQPDPNETDTDDIDFGSPQEEREKKETRLREVNALLKKAYDGETLPNEEYRALKEEQAELRAILGHN